MTLSIADTIDQIAPRLPSALVSSTALAAVRRVAASLPATLTQWIDLECRLQSGSPQVDLSIRVDAVQARALARVARRPARAAHAPDGSRTSAAAWQRVAAMAAAWDAATAAGDVEGLWLEFDLREDAAPLPRMFIDFARNRWTPHESAARVRAVLAPHVSGAWMRDAIARCVDRLPSDVELRYVGLPADDEIRVIRLCLLARDERHALECLTAVRWPGDIEPVRRLCDRWRRSRGADHTNGAILHLDVTPSAAPADRIGLECPFRRRPQVKGVLTDAAFLDELVACGACSAAKRDALMRWAGCELASLPHALSPRLLLRRISHVKVVFDRDRDPEAKAYLCAAHLARPRAAAAVRPPALFANRPIAP